MGGKASDRVCAPLDQAMPEVHITPRLQLQRPRIVLLLKLW